MEIQIYHVRWIWMVKTGFFSTGRDAMAPIWLVVGGEQTGGIVVRAGAA
jgi:hypothetical protein